MRLELLPVFAFVTSNGIVTPESSCEVEPALLSTNFLTFGFMVRVCILMVEGVVDVEGTEREVFVSHFCLLSTGELPLRRYIFLYVRRSIV